MTNALVLTPAEVNKQVQYIQHLMKDGMQENTHFGKVPGCGDKKALFKAGAEKIGFMFKLRAEFSTEIVELGNNHREYRVTTHIYNSVTGALIGQGVGSCSTLEKKYRYRKEWKNKESVYVENPDIADQYNTVLKMAKKRSHVDAIITTTAASDVFTQDIEEDFDFNAGGAEIKEELDIEALLKDAEVKDTPPKEEKAEVKLTLEDKYKVATSASTPSDVSLKLWEEIFNNPVLTEVQFKKFYVGLNESEKKQKWTKEQASGVLRAFNSAKTRFGL